MGLVRDDEKSMRVGQAACLLFTRTRGAFRASDVPSRGHSAAGEGHTSIDEVLANVFGILLARPVRSQAHNHKHNLPASLAVLKRAPSSAVSEACTSMRLLELSPVSKTRA
jgi:hypothetical protein